ncbi:RimJ/RimL family protein N-acetyltransferase [Tamaricihabitans halophyticus]|uniref:RimJ/RimL family protein N-acetyltransferase n=1 Tax=Tamaricihabitans halophyticus TaxID=1262583 RepID=A0A4R2RBB6_9PSEU|nr:GNAT family N-acetyltransferase [Tamaricihabitans halophyticus]TCP57001.1 RimJ/RimL family protein N-acetyltransferase [Tamaricihabitans halophyticus]
MDPWPVRHLVLRTPRLELRPDDDAGLFELAALAEQGIHPPERMPFLEPWTDALPEELGRNMVQHYWRKRADRTSQDWELNLLVRKDGVVIGTQGISTIDFATTREVGTGSWLGMRYQGAGLGTEMRAAALLFAFDYLGVELAVSGAFQDNPASNRVSAKLGYRTTGTRRHAVRGKLAIENNVELTEPEFRRPQWSLEVVGFEKCRAWLLDERPG